MPRTLFFQESLLPGGGTAMRRLPAEEVARLVAQGQRCAA